MTNRGPATRLDVDGACACRGAAGVSTARADRCFIGVQTTRRVAAAYGWDALDTPLVR